MADINEVKSLIRSCLLTSKGGTTIKDLCRDYESLESEVIPFRRLGFSSVLALIDSLPGFRTFRRGDTVYVEAVVTAETAHIASMVAKQRTKSKRRRPMSRDATRYRRPNISTSTHNSRISSVPRNTHGFSRPVNSSLRNTNQPLRRPPVFTSVTVYPPKNSEPPKSPPVPSNNRPTNIPSLMDLPMPSINREMNNRNVSHVCPPQPPSPFSQQQRTNLAERIARPSPPPLLPLPNATRSPRENVSNDRHVTFLTAEVKYPSSKASPMVAPLPPISRSKPSPPLLQSPELKDPRDELLHLVKLLNLSTPEYKIFQNSKQNKINAKLCSVTVGPKKYSSYPAEAKTEDEAQKLAAAQAVLDIHKTHGPLVQLQVTNDIEVIKQRIIAIVDLHMGVLVDQIPIYYKETHHENLPNNWVRIVEDCPTELTLEKNGINNSFILWRYNPAIHKPKEPLSPNLENVPSVIGDTVPAPLVLPKENLWPVYVQYVVNSTEIWAIINEDNYNNRLVTMTEELSKSNVEFKQPAKSIQAGQFYVTKDDEGWFRVRVDNINVATNEADIFFIDTGDYDTISCKELYPLEKRFCDVPAQAIRLSLLGLEEFENCEKISNLAEDALSEQHFYVSVYNRDSDDDGTPLSVIFYDTSGTDDINVNDLILQKLLSTDVSLTSGIERRCIEVYISNVELNGDIHIQMKPEDLKIVATLINRLVSPSLDVESFKKAAVTDKIDVNEVYLVKCPDGNWLRSRVLEMLNGSKLRMSLIDFGGSIIVDNKKLLRLRPLSPFLEKYPQQARKIQLHNIEKSNFNQQMMDRLLELAPRSERLLCKVIKLIEVPVVELFKRSQPDNALISINNTLALLPEIDRNIEDGNNNVKPKKRLERILSRCSSIDNDNELKCLRRPKIPAVGQIFNVHITNLAANPSNFIVQPYEDVETLKAMMSQLQIACNEYIGPMLMGDSLREGKLCAAKYNGGWYRACINGIIDTQTVVVYLCDYGDMTPIGTENLQPLKKQFTDLPYQGIKARLYGIGPLNVDWTPHTCKRFQDLVANKDFASTVRHVEKDDTSPTESILTLELIDVSTDNDIKIHEILVKEKWAILTVNA